MPHKLSRLTERAFGGGWLRSFGVMFTTLIFLVGCDTNQSNGERYLERLASALRLQVDAPQASLLPPFPSPNALRIERPAQKINLLEYLEVNRCDLGALIGARNSGLGRVQTPSQRWLYDTRLVRGLLGCEGATPELIALATQRQSELGVAAFNALFTGPEWRAFVTPPLVVAKTTGLSSGVDERVPAETGFDAAKVERASLALTALFIESRTGGKSRGEAMSLLEDHLATLRFSRALGIQRRAWATQSDTLERATRMLLSALATNPACRTGAPTERGKIRRNIFEQFYVVAMQPELAAQGQPDRGWVRAVADLVTSTLVVTGAQATVDESSASVAQVMRVKDWHQRVFGLSARSEYGRWKAAITAHSRAWQRQLGICGLMPGIEPTTGS